MVGGEEEEVDMLKETYLAKLVEMRQRRPDAEFIVITRTAHSILSPSEKLLSDYKRAEKDWEIDGKPGIFLITKKIQRRNND